jgi:3-oxoacyl-[acyl-carrier-protein] synthase III
VLTLEQVGAYVPQTSVPVGELREPLGLTAGQERVITRFLGLDRVTVAPGVELADMLTAAGEQALRGVDRGTVRHLIHAHTMQHVATASPHMLQDVRRSLGLRNASVLGLSHMNCVVGLHAVQIARFLLRGAAPGDRVLIVVGDKIVSDRLRLIPDTTVLGEAAAACLVGSDPAGDRVLGRALEVDGRFHECLACPEPLLDEYKRVYADGLRRVMRAAIADAGRTPEEISAVLPHNVNRLSWKRISNDLGIPVERVYLDNVPRTGHCYSSDPFVNLATARESGRVQPGDLVLMTTAGLGAAFAATVVQIGEGRDR